MLSYIVLPKTTTPTNTVAKQKDISMTPNLLPNHKYPGKTLLTHHTHHNLPTVLQIHSLTACIPVKTAGFSVLPSHSPGLLSTPCNCHTPDSDWHIRGEPLSFCTHIVRGYHALCICLRGMSHNRTWSQSCDHCTSCWSYKLKTVACGSGTEQN